MEQIGNVECQQQIERCSNRTAVKKDESNIFEELTQLCDISIDENLNEAFHSRVEDDAVAFLLAHIGAENLVSSLNEKPPVPFKELNWSNLDRFKKKTPAEPGKTPEIKKIELRHTISRSIASESVLGQTVDGANESASSSDTDFDPEKDDAVIDIPKVHPKPRRQNREKKIPKVAKPKSPSKRGRKPKDNSEPSSSTTIEIEQEAEWIAKTNKIWRSIFHKVGGRVYGSGRAASSQISIRKTGLIWTQRYICLAKGPNDQPCQARVIMSVYTNDPGSIAVREYQYHSHDTSDLLRPEE